MSQKLTDPSILDLFVKTLNQIYNCDTFPLTHPSQLFRTKFYLKTFKRKKISLLIFSNGTIFIQGSPQIPQEIFQTETKQILNLVKDL